jgi:hypothetical protein
MRQAEIEQRLLDPDGQQRLLETARRLGVDAAVVGRQADAATEIRRAGDTPFSVKATAEDVLATDLDNAHRRSWLADIGSILPEFADQTPVATLEAVIERYRRQPTEINEYLVRDAIVRLTSLGELDADAQPVVMAALETLTEVPLEYQDGGQPKDSIWSFLYRHSDFKGTSALAFLGPSSVYSSLREPSLRNIELHDRISSLRLDASAGEVRGDCYLFEHERFLGRFVGIRTNAGDPTQSVDVSYVGNSMNDRTSSVLLARRFSNERVRAIGDPVSKALIANIVADVGKVERLRGDPVFTWDMWPDGGDSHPNDPDKRFVQIKIPVEIDVNNWFNYDAEIWLWFYLYIGQPSRPLFGEGGELRGHLAHYGAWVEGGIISDKVLDGIMDALPSQFGAIEMLLNTLVGSVNAAAPFTNVFLLPGDQSQFVDARYLEGHVDDNVSVVLLKTAPPVLTQASTNLY